MATIQKNIYLAAGMLGSGLLDSLPSSSSHREFGFSGFASQDTRRSKLSMCAVSTASHLASWMRLGLAGVYPCQTYTFCKSDRISQSQNGPARPILVAATLFWVHSHRVGDHFKRWNWKPDLDVRSIQIQHLHGVGTHMVGPGNYVSYLG